MLTPATPFDLAHRWSRVDDHRWTGEVTEGWLQGRGAFGGLQAAVAMRAFDSLVEPDRLARTLTVHFAGPLELGAAHFEGRVERAGGSVTHCSGRITQNDQVVAMMLATYGRPRDHCLEIAAEPPPKLREPRALRMPQAPGIPAFTRYVEMDFVEGPPFGGAERAKVSGWVRFIDPQPVDVPLLAAVADIWPPAGLAVAKGPRRSSSVDLSYHFFPPYDEPPIAPETFFCFAAECPTGKDGFTEERGSLWTADGRLVVRVRQLRAVY